jgi:hypothetical protein
MLQLPFTKNSQPIVEGELGDVNVDQGRRFTNVPTPLYY